MVRLKGMKAGILLSFTLVLLYTASCKKYCYTCSQYCAYCVKISDSTFHFKACANETQGESAVDSFRQVWQSAGYQCSLLNNLNNPTNFCDDKNGASSAINYYGNEDYYCYPQQ